MEEGERRHRQRRRAAKRFNERLKLGSAGLNGVAVAILITGVVLPYVSGSPVRASPLLVIGVALTLHGIGQIVLGAWRSED